MPLTPALEIPWPSGVSDGAAEAVQRCLAARVVERDEPAPPRQVVGLDIGFAERGAVALARAAAVVVTFPQLEPVERRVIEQPVHFPYVPGYLAFREAPALLAVLAALDATPDLVLVDGQGRLHPRRCGLACHVGVLLDRPTIGCAKSRLLRLPDPQLADEVGGRAPLRHEGELVGVTLRTRRGARPVYVSVGHRITLGSAVDLVLATCRGHRLPEPLRMAHLLASGRP